MLDRFLEDLIHHIPVFAAFGNEGAGDIALTMDDSTSLTKVTIYR